MLVIRFGDNELTGEVGKIVEDTETHMKHIFGSTSVEIVFQTSFVLVSVLSDS